MRRRRFLAAGAAALLAPRLRAQDGVAAMRFSDLRAGAPLPPEFRAYAFEGQSRRTEYTLVTDEGRTVLRARAEASTAGIIRDLRVDPAAQPTLAWRWKATRLPEKGDLRTKAGDDYAARLYVTFDLPLAALPFGERFGVTLARIIYGKDVPSAALCYVWATRASVGTVAPNAYTGRVQMIVVESGADALGQWRSYARDIAADYRRAFGAEPPPVSGVVVSTDTDNTGARAETYYGDIDFRARRIS
ncbi:MAG: DUF3047 domain-containing protein [Betaproteobacteria bacterium]|nr:DUF3047 domain-containing protein [Betaproteobacteria bacterium]MDH4322592.1 DUF3047 domain-containing protein [Betaproteobacteria bacterium]MDH5576841.1 DUF3047 domain-containing protein [Betaproteobacteria bacterium]